MGRYKTIRSVIGAYDHKLYELVKDFGASKNILSRNGKVNIRQSSKEFAEYFEDLRWRYLALKNRKL